MTKFFSLLLLLIVNVSWAQNTYTSSLGMEFVQIQPGSFVVGKFQPTVVNHAFYIGKYEVTQSQWEQVWVPILLPSWMMKGESSGGEYHVERGSTVCKKTERAGSTTHLPLADGI